MLRTMKLDTNADRDDDSIAFVDISNKVSGKIVHCWNRTLCQGEGKEAS